MNILVTLDKNYLDPLKTMLGSLFVNNPLEKFDIYVIGDNLDQKDYEDLEEFSISYNSRIIEVKFDNEIFSDAPSLRYYSRAMYYRLLAADLLDKNLDKILYLDPDILVINSVKKLYNIDFGDNIFAAASHGDRLGLIDTVNRIRLSNKNAQSYYNSGVLLMDLEKMRKYVKKEEVFSYIKEHAKDLILPDQDALNALYGHKILSLDDSIYNYDTRHFEKHLLESRAQKDIDWVVENTVFLHFCGKNKPWHKGYLGYFSALYKHYIKLIDKNRLLIK